jgi:RNA polymerase sigma-70 factor, ECF subfamily
LQDPVSAAVETLIARQGRDAFERGDADGSRRAFEAALAEQKSGEPFEALARAVYLGGDYRGSIEAHERAFAEYKREDDALAPLEQRAPPGAQGSLRPREPVPSQPEHRAGQGPPPGLGAKPKPTAAALGRARRMSCVQESSLKATPDELERRLEQHRTELTAYCYRMLASPFEAEDAVQETLLRAWRSIDRFEGRAALRSWLYRIATNVCLDMLSGRERRARPMDLGPAREPVESNLHPLPEATWIQPAPDSLVAPEGDPAEVAVSRETIRLAFVAALQHLPARQRAVLILCEVLRWKASEVAELLETSVASVNSALQRARATLDASCLSSTDPAPLVDESQRALLARYVEAFERYDIEALTSLIREDATQSMPPYDLWLRGRDDIFAWWFGPGIGCRDSRLVPTAAANGSPAFGQYKPSASGSGYDPWALQVLELSPSGIAELSFFLDTDTLFPLFGLPPRLDA